MSKKLTNDDFCRAAKRLKCEVASIKAVAEVESLGNGFYDDGFPVILFERHKFKSFTQGRYNSSHPDISGAAGGYGKAGQNQRNKFNKAFALNPKAAMKSCSWGKFQIMGFNHAVCGYATVDKFVDAMKESEGKQLDAFVSFVIGNGLADELRANNWKAFAKGYNGSGYAKNKYDTKMAAAYKKFAKENIDCSKVSAFTDKPISLNLADSFVQPEPVEPVEPIAPENAPETAAQTSEQTQKIETGNASVEVKTGTINEQNVTEDAPVAEPAPQGFMKKLIAGVVTLSGSTIIYDSVGKFAGIQFTAQTVYILMFIIFLAFLGFCVWAVLDTIKKNKRTELEAMANTAVDRKNIKWVKSE